MAKAARSQAEESAKQAKGIATQMVKIHKEFKKCKNGEEFNDVDLNPSLHILTPITDDDQ